MIIEQAFHALPEMLAGSGYPVYRYEASIVGAFSMALLQEFNIRNVNFPVQHILFEKSYNEEFQARCDINVTYKKLHDVYKDALEIYGQREENWIEAKLFRPKDKNLAAEKGFGRNSTGNGTTQRRALLEDLLRLCLLADEKNGRYLLHIYTAHPKKCLVIPNRDDDDERVRKTKYEWARILSSTIGNRTLDIGREGDLSFLKCPEGLEVSVKVTNYLLKPTDIESNNPKYFWMVLTRIRSCEWKKHKDLNEEQANQIKIKFRDILAGNINSKVIPFDQFIFETTDIAR